MFEERAQGLRMASAEQRAIDVVEGAAGDSLAQHLRAPVAIRARICSMGKKQLHEGGMRDPGCWDPR